MGKDITYTWAGIGGDIKPMTDEEVLNACNAIMMPEDIQPAAGMKRVWFGNTCVYDADNPDSVPYTVEYDDNQPD